MKTLICSTLVVLFSFGSVLQAERPASVDELNRLAVAASEDRKADREKLEQFFSSDLAQRALKQARMDPKQVTRAIASLDPDDAKRLAARAETAQRDFAAGALTNQQLTYIVIAIGTALLVILIFVAAD